VDFVDLHSVSGKVERFYLRDPEGKNPYYPLPENYGIMHPIEQKQARMKILLDQSTPLGLVRAWFLFRSIYLKPLGNSFYRTGFSESPEFHFQMVYDLGDYARNADAAPRGSAKSTIIGIEIILLLLLTRPYFAIALGLATDNLVEVRFDTIIEQITTNPLIIEDFGNLKPAKGDATFNRHYIHLTNGATLQGFSVLGKKRGARPNLFILDDPESDPDNDSKESMQLLTEKFQNILFRQIMPMLECGSSIFWIGTLINRRAYLYHAVNNDDPRFTFWNRRVYKTIYSDYANPTKSKILWDSRWTPEWIAAKRAELGEATFKAECQNDPSTDTERSFNIDARKNEYTINPDTVDDNLENNPLESSAEIMWYEKPDPMVAVYSEVKKPLKDFLKDLYIIGTFDYAQGMAQHNDYSCIGIVGFDGKNTMWVLDGWMGRAKEPRLYELILQYGMKWKCKVIGIESASTQINFYDSVSTFVNEKAGVVGWRPRVMPIKYPANTSKSKRIAGTGWRFDTGKIKYPAHLKNKWPMSQLYTQTLDFTEDLALLPFDDMIDCVLGMPQYVVHARGSKFSAEAPQDDSLIERIKKGQPLQGGLPFLADVNPLTLKPAELAALEQRTYAKNNQGRQTGVIIRPRVMG